MRFLVILIKRSNPVQKNVMKIAFVIKIDEVKDGIAQDII
jgi:hypothetical protein